VSKSCWWACLCVLAVVATGCGPRVEFMQYRGVQDWPVGGAFVRVVKGMDVYEGLPDRAYEVVGLIDIYDQKPFFENAIATHDVLDHAKKNNADALVWLSKRAILSGSLRVAATVREPAELDTGHSTQPLVTRVRGAAHANGDSVQYAEDVWVEPQRSTLLVIRWK